MQMDSTQAEHFSQSIRASSPSFPLSDIAPLSLFGEVNTGVENKGMVVDGKDGEKGMVDVLCAVVAAKRVRQRVQV